MHEMPDPLSVAAGCKVEHFTSPSRARAAEARCSRHAALRSTLHARQDGEGNRMLPRFRGGRMADEPVGRSSLAHPEIAGGYRACLQCARIQRAPGAAVRKLDVSAAPISTALGVLGMPGRPYVGCSISKAQGETSCVAASARGSVVGQMAKIKGSARSASGR